MHGLQARPFALRACSTVSEDADVTILVAGCGVCDKQSSIKFNVESSGWDERSAVEIC